MPRKILIVDDQKGVRRLLEELFKKEGWNVHIAADGMEAIDRVQEVDPDIVLMDMKIVMMTAYGEMDVVKKALEAGVLRCITKPFDILRLRDLVVELVTDRVS